MNRASNCTHPQPTVSKSAAYASGREASRREPYRAEWGGRRRLNGGFPACEPCLDAAQVARMQTHRSLEPKLR